LGVEFKFLLLEVAGKFLQWTVKVPQLSLERASFGIVAKYLEVKAQK
jgi:hypothetical protein